MQTDAEIDAEQARDRETMTAEEFRAKWPLADSEIVRFFERFGKLAH